MKVVALVEENLDHLRQFEASALTVDPLLTFLRFSTVVDLIKSLQDPLCLKPNYIFVSKEDFPGYCLMKSIKGFNNSIPVTCFSHRISPVEGAALLEKGASYFYEVPGDMGTYSRLLSGIINGKA